MSISSWATELFYDIGGFIEVKIWYRKVRPLWYRLKSLEFHLLNGYRASDVYGLYYRHAQWCLKRVSILRKTTRSYPMGLTEYEWDEILFKICLAFHIIVESDETIEEKYHSDRAQEQIKEGLELFAEWYNSLWD